MNLYLSKTNPLDERAGKYIGTMLKMFADENLSDKGTVDHHLCQVIDVFVGKIHTAPRSQRQRFEDIEVACEEIARGWKDL